MLGGNWRSVTHVQWPHHCMRIYLWCDWTLVCISSSMCGMCTVTQCNQRYISGEILPHANGPFYVLCQHFAKSDLDSVSKNDSMTGYFAGKIGMIARKIIMVNNLSSASRRGISAWYVHTMTPTVALADAASRSGYGSWLRKFWICYSPVGSCHSGIVQEVQLVIWCSTTFNCTHHDNGNTQCMSRPICIMVWSLARSRKKSIH